MAVAEGLMEFGIRSMLVWVLTENCLPVSSTRRLVQDTVQERPITIGGASLSEVAYGWKDLNRLVTMRN